MEGWLFAASFFMWARAGSHQDTAEKINCRYDLSL
jgi:hypothetical protein